MSIRAIFSLSALAASLWATGPAAAQYYYGPAPSPYNVPPPGWGEPPPLYGEGPYLRYGHVPGPRPISARAVIDRLEDLGFDDIGHPRFTGALYVVDATAPGGLRQQVTVDAIRGVILNRVVIGRVPDLDDGDERPRLRYGVPRRSPDGADDPRLRRAPERREASRAPPGDAVPPSEGLPRPGIVDSAPLPPPSGEATTGPRPGAGATPRPFEGRSGEKVTRAEPRTTVKPSEPAPRPFGINPGAVTSPPAEKVTPDGQARAPTGTPDRKGTLPPPAPKATAEARPQPNRPVRVIPGVPVIGGPTGESGAVGATPEAPHSPKAAN